MDQLCKKNITIKVLTHAADVNVSIVSRACLKIPRHRYLQRLWQKFEN